MRISELAKQSGFSIDTIRFYEKQGLLDDTHFERLPNNYRRYNDAALDRLTLIRWAKLLGFTLSEIRTTIGDWEVETLTLAQKEAIFCQKLAEIDAHIARLGLMKAYLFEKLTWLREGRLPAKGRVGAGIAAQLTGG